MKARTKWDCRLLLFLAAGLAAACSSDGDGDPAEPEVRGDTLVEVRLVDFRFSPANVIIDEGTRVRWIADTGGHTITPDAHSEWQRFPTNGLLARGDTFEHVFDAAGEFPYFCEPHLSAGMVGSIEVR